MGWVLRGPVGDFVDAHACTIQDVAAVSQALSVTYLSGGLAGKYAVVSKTATLEGLAGHIGAQELNGCHFSRYLLNLAG